MSDATSKNKALMRRIYEEMWNKGKPTLAVEIFEQPAGVERFVSQFLLSFPDLQHTVEEMIAEGDQIAVKFSAHGMHTGQWQGFAPTGKSIHYTGMTWARIAKGRVDRADGRVAIHRLRKSALSLHHRGVFQKDFRSLPQPARFPFALLFINNRL